MADKITLPTAPIVSDVGSPAFFGLYQVFATTTCQGMEYYADYAEFVGPRSSIIVGLTYLVAIVVLRHFVKNGSIPILSKKDQNLKSFLWWYNIFQIVTNTYMFLIFFAAYQNFGYVEKTTKLVERTAILFWIVKVVDFVDTAVIILKGDWKRLSLLHVFHHATMPFHTGTCLVCGHAKGFGLMSCHVNSFIHMVMYSHYLMTSLAIRNPFKKYITMLQLGQFTILFSRSIFCIFYYPPNRDFALQEMCYQLYMLYLFQQFFDKAYKKPVVKRVTKSVEEAHITVDGKCLDISEFYSKHPGGKVISFFFGEDASDEFHTFHRKSKNAYELLNTLPRADFEVKNHNNTAFAKGFRKLKMKWLKDGLFDSKPEIDFAYGAIIVFVMAWSFKVAKMGYLEVSAILMGIAWTHCGFLQHNAGHRAVFESNDNNYIMQNIVEGLMKGGSASWWRNRHMKHHATPNIMGQDTDLHTHPVLAWAEEVAEKCDPSLIQYQHVYFIPLLSLYVPVFFVTTKLFMWRKAKYHEMLLVLAHHALFMHLLPEWSWYQILVWHFIGYAVQGVYLGFSFSLSHFSMPTFKDKSFAESYDFYALQCETTLNYTSGNFFAFLVGHLNFQIEHHTVPTMPVTNYVHVWKDIQALCKEHNVPYRNVTFWEAIQINFDTLKRVGAPKAKKA